MISVYSLGFRVIEILIYSKAISTAYSDVILGILAIYYFSWVLGVKRDFDSQKNTFSLPPNSGKIPLVGFLICVSMLFIFGIAIYFHRDYQILLFALTIFLIINYIGWKYLKQIYEKPIHASFKKYKSNKDFISYEKLKISSAWLYSEWQTKRFQFAGVTIVLIYIYTFFLNTCFSQIMALDSTIIMPVILISFYLLGVECMPWKQRVIRDNLLNQMSRLERKYDLIKK